MEYQPQHHIPDFMKKYYEALDEEGQIHLDNLAGHYQRERQEYLMKNFAAQSAFQTDWNRMTGSGKQLDPEQVMEASGINAQFGERSLEIAKKHGYVEPQSEELTEQQKLDALNAQAKPDAGNLKKGNGQRVTKEGEEAPAQEQGQPEQQRQGQTAPPDQSQSEIATQQEQFRNNLEQMRQQQGQQMAGPAQQPMGEDHIQEPQTDQQRFAAKLAEMQSNTPAITQRHSMH